MEQSELPSIVSIYVSPAHPFAITQQLLWRTILGIVVFSIIVPPLCHHDAIAPELIGDCLRNLDDLQQQQVEKINNFMFFALSFLAFCRSRSQ